ncbi:hypothetical protein DBR12_18485 [Acidovorax sp. HMWF029]|uniref:DUF6402 family protein n=1 Tax=Acidovorax sp. HMWF029 TaxID=2056863 RepID=UPI000D33E51B|nr:DUF6402 family protein [Acidovorax sp. HMWF029]PTT17311.1 hypothetical protein DBR12_18485 [Acidovorax sp. HMWF029]
MRSNCAQLEKKLPPKKLRFQLLDIPEVMRSRLGWPVAASLMERWFRSPAFEMSDSIKRSLTPNQLHKLPEAQLDENKVSMAWALGFVRVQAAMLQLQKNWANPAGLKQLQTRIERQSNGRNQQCWRFGNLSQTAKLLDANCQVNIQKIGESSDPMDDFYGAMGEATLKVAVSGIVSPKGAGKAKIEIDELAFYLRDSYDFNDDSFVSQPLGFWGFNGVVRALRFPSNVPITDEWVHEDAASLRSKTYLVQNKHFREWRAKNGKGGDFMIVSDVHRVRLPIPLQLEW